MAFSVYSRDLRLVHIAGISATLSPATGSQSIYLSIPGIPSDANLKRLRIYSDDLAYNGGDTFDIKYLSNPAAYRAAEAAAVGTGEQYVLAAHDDDTSETGPNTKYVTDNLFPTDVQWRDDLGSEMFHMLFTNVATMSAYARMNVEVWAEGLPRLWEIQHQTRHTTHDKTHPQVLRWSSGNAWSDLTEAVKDIKGNQEKSFSLFSAQTDYIYFGMNEVWTGLWFRIATASTQSMFGETATWEYYDTGSTWSALTVRDNCTDGHTITPTLFSHSGVVEWDDPGDWQATTLDAAVGGTPPWDYLPTSGTTKYENKYWVRLNLSGITGQPVFYWIRRKPYFVSNYTP